MLQWPPHSPHLNPKDHLWDVVEGESHVVDQQLTNQVPDAPGGIKAVRKARGFPNLYQQEQLIKWPVSVHCTYTSYCTCKRFKKSKESKPFSCLAILVLAEV